MPGASKNEDGLTEGQEKFCKLYVETGVANESYRQAYGSKANRKCLDPKASKLLQKEEVQARIRLLKEEIHSNYLDKTVIDREFIAEGILRNSVKAEKAGDHNIAIRGYKELGEMYDLSLEKQNDRVAVTDKEKNAIIDVWKDRLLNVTYEEVT